FYPILTLAFMLMLIYMRRDFGPMFKSEVHARNTGEVQPVRAGGHTESVEDLSPVEGAPLKWYNAAVPVLLVILVTIFGLLDTGLLSCYNELVEKGLPVASSGWGDTWAGLSALITDEGSGFFVKLGKVIGAADSYVALLWASLTGVIAAILLTLRAKVMRIGPAISTLITGFKTMLPAIMILTLAWSLAATTETLHTATYLTGALADSLNPFLLPPIVFALAAVISFSTGSSWSTMAILYPIVIPLTWAICHHNNGLPPEMSTELLLNVIAVTLAASVLGDHCSPISDTTILSSLASDCNHIEHVRTQLPYALTVGAVSLVAGGVTTGLGGGWAISFVMLLASLGVLFLIVRRFGKRVE
ncbi:MAG TPA: Na+/H+ antiporter NhaC family protein, partial [Flavilitoribacter sp.]|nr:Na+/H+ antiporter NhaC family protein [Flavilitoribacter sp.]